MATQFCSLMLQAGVIGQLSEGTADAFFRVGLSGGIWWAGMWYPPGSYLLCSFYMYLKI